MTRYYLNITIFYQFFSNNNQQPQENIMSGPFQITSLSQLKHNNNVKGNQWPKQDLIKYAVYLKFTENTKHNLTEIDCNSWSFFRKLSIFIQSKNPNQCRIFHKKMMSDHSSVASLLSELKESIHKFQEWEQYYEPSLLNIKVCLNREREEAQKQLTNKKTISKVSIDYDRKGLQQVHNHNSLVKNSKEDGPTGLEYEDDKSMKPSSFSTFREKQRPSLSFCMEQQQSLPNDDLSIFNFPVKQGFASFSKQNTVQKQELKQMVKDCQNSFQSYFKKLSRLSNVMCGSFSEY